MAEINVDNMEQNSELFKQKMGFPHDAEGLEMTDEQLVNFLLLCHQSQHGIGQNEEMESEDGSVKVKIMKVGGDMTEMMDEVLGHGGPKMTSYWLPVKKVNGGYKWGKSGKTYKSKSKAKKQGRAIYASGYKGKGK